MVIMAGVFNVPLPRDFTAERDGPSESTESKKGGALFVFVLIICDGRTRLGCPDLCPSHVKGHRNYQMLSSISPSL